MNSKVDPYIDLRKTQYNQARGNYESKVMFKKGKKVTTFG